MCWKLHTLTSVVVDNFNIVRIALPEGKANPPAGIDPHRPLTRSIPLEFMESYAFERTEILQSLGDVQGRQQIYRRGEIQAAKLVGRFALPHPAARRVTPRPDHGRNILRGAVKRQG